jgi:hypothetical protein
VGKPKGKDISAVDGLADLFEINQIPLSPYILNSS